MGADDLNLRWFFDELLAIGKPVSFFTIQRRVKKQSIVPAPFTPESYARDFETPLLALGWRKKGDKLVPPLSDKPAVKGSIKPVSPKRLRLLRDQCLEIAMQRFIDGDGSAGELAAALRSLPFDPPAEAPPAQPAPNLSKADMDLIIKAYQHEQEDVE